MAHSRPGSAPGVVAKMQPSRGRLLRETRLLVVEPNGVCVSWRKQFSGLLSREKNPALNNHLILLGVPNMKISILGPLTLGALALAAGSAFADVGPNVQDSSGNA